MPVATSQTFGEIFFQLALEQRRYQYLAWWGWFSFFIFLKLKKFRFQLEMHMVSSIKKYKMLYIRKSPSKRRWHWFTFSCSSLLNTAKYSGKNAPGNQKRNLKGRRERAGWVGLRTWGRTVQWVPLAFLFNLPCVLVWALEGVYNLESPTSIDKRRRKGKKKERKTCSLLTKDQARGSPISLPISSSGGGLNLLAGAVSAEVIRAYLLCTSHLAAVAGPIHPQWQGSSSPVPTRWPAAPAFYPVAEGKVGRFPATLFPPSSGQLGASCSQWLQNRKSTSIRQPEIRPRESLHSVGPASLIPHPVKPSVPGKCLEPLQAIPAGIEWQPHGTRKTQQACIALQGPWELNCYWNYLHTKFK